jgi:membrane-associated protease RseP (regulator of RpoE activity)
MQTFIDIVIMLVILGVLVSIHEAGHLAMAKLFRVYCFDYSIGFGPAFLHKKRKNGETYFSLRAFPLGGYVSMYGEPGVAPDGVEPPAPERSIEGIAKWKKCLVLVAGVTLNYLLGLVLIFVSVSAFTQYYSAYSYDIPGYETVVTDASSYAETFGSLGKATYSDDFLSKVEAAKSAEYEAKDYYLYLGTSYYPNLSSAANYGSIVDSNVIIYNKDGTEYQENGKTITFVALYTPTVLTSAHSLTGYLNLYPATDVDPATVSPVYAETGVTHFPDVPKSSDEKSKAFNTANLSDGDCYFTLSTILIPSKGGEDPLHWDKKITVKSGKIEIANKSWTNPGLTVDVISGRNNWQKSWKQWAGRTKLANVASIQGLGSLFTPEGWKNASGIVGMTAAVGTVSAMGGAANVFFYAGLISINLAFFNLLPFPGLDGWALLVTLIEGIVNSVKRSKFKKEHPGEKFVEVLPPLEDEETAKAKKEAAKEASTTETPKAVEPLARDANGALVYTKWRISAKIKGWVSMVGLGLLFLMAILITIKDIIGLL